MNRLTLISALAILVLAAALGLILVLDKQDADDLALAPAPPAASATPSTDTSSEPASQVASTQPAEEGAPSTGEQARTIPSFDIVRVNPSGDAVIAGRAGPGDKVAVLDNGESIGSVAADDNGEWVFLPNGALNPGEHSLTLEAEPENGGTKSKSERAVVVVVPEIAKDITGKATEAPAGALAIEVPIEGGGAVRILNLPGQAGEVVTDTTVSISAVDYGDSGTTAFSGRAPAKSRLIGYLNNQPVAEVTADDKGQWSIEGASPVGNGPHRFRIDEVDAEGKVMARAEIMFEMILPGTTGVLPELAEQNIVVVKPGQNLWLLARRSYGSGFRYTIIFEANRNQISNPDLIYPGQVLQLPPG